MAAPQDVRLRADYIWETPDDGYRYEVIDGNLVMSPPPDFMHQYGQSVLFKELARHIGEHDLGIVVCAPTGVILSDDTAVEPDLLFVSKARLYLLSKRGVEGPPDLVVEFLSPSTRAHDLGLKLHRYAAAGIPHYWTCDPDSHRIVARELGPDGYVVVADAGRGEVFSPRLFPGLEIPVDSIWKLPG